MPTLEIRHSLHISGSIRLNETTTEQIDQFSGFVRASAVDVVDKEFNYVFSK